MGDFPKELDSAWRKRKKELGRELTTEEGAQLQGELFESWVDARRYDELIRRIHHEYDVGGGTHECAVLGYALRRDKDAERIHALFRGLLTRRTKAFRESWPAAEAGQVGPMLLASQRMASAMETYVEYFQSLASLGLKEQGEQLRAEMMAFQARIDPKAARK